MSQEIYRTTLRLIFAFGCFGFSFWAAKHGYEKNLLTLMVSSVPVFALGICAIWKFIFKLFTGPLIAMVDGLFFPGGKLEKPTLNFKLPAYLINQGRYTEALEEYQIILKHYPDEVEAYEKSIWLYCEIFEENEKALRLLKRAARRNLVIDDRFRSLAGQRDELRKLEKKTS
ncbi:MAG: hypothetical protein AAGF67_08095 [Verrucomicrobiota bacterium]